MTIRSSITHNITVFPTNEELYNSTTASDVLFEDQSLGHVLIGSDGEELRIEPVCSINDNVLCVLFM